MAVIPVELAGREYEVRVGHGLLQSIATEAEPFLRKRHVCIVADINARENWGDAVSRSLELAAQFAQRCLQLPQTRRHG